MAILDEVKAALRVTTTDAGITGEIQDIIDSCKQDLAIGGANNTDDTDPFVKRAIILYAKANFGLKNDNMEKYQQMYEKHKITMGLSSSYQTAP